MSWYVIGDEMGFQCDLWEAYRRTADESVKVGIQLSESWETLLLDV
jgi:hypothetical protein